MQVVILAGGFGSRLGEETSVKPKPMVEIGGKPILWHIMKMYSSYGLNDFIICLGYKGHIIKDYFANYLMHNSSVKFDLANDEMNIIEQKVDPWKVTLVDTGEDSMTGGRLKRIKPFLESNTFCMTYGDGVADVNIKRLLDFHYSHGKLATVTAVRPMGRFGAIELKENSDQVCSFEEKPVGDGGVINGGFFVLSAEVLDVIEGDQTIFEREPMLTLVEKGELLAFNHTGFWQPMDTIRERNILENLWQENKAPWRTWK